MLKGHLTLALGSALLLSLASTAMAQSSSGSSGSMSGSSMSSSHKGPVNSKDTMFMKEAAAGNLAEIQMGRIALDKSSSSQIKETAQRIIDDHTKANDQLMTLAQRQQVTLPTEPMLKDRKEAKKLESMSGTAFDKAYARMLVMDHRKDIKKYGMESRKAKDTELRQYASTTLPVLKTHLQMAEQLSKHGSKMRSNGRMGKSNSMNHADGTPMGDANGSSAMPASGSSTH